MSDIKSNLVSVEWLSLNLQNPNLVILDATMKLAPNGDPIPEPKSYIPGALEFNFDTEICNKKTKLPHMLCSEIEFEEAAQSLGINTESEIVVYDAMGIFSSPRVWWMFKIMGHQNVFVLDGGLPKWVQQNKPTESSLSKPCHVGNFVCHFKPSLLSSSQQVLDAISSPNIEIIDARSKQRFLGEEAEPRVGLRNGHIPSSDCIPFSNLIENGLFKSKQQLQEIFTKKKAEDQHTIFSCGSGVTACILALGFDQCGFKHWSIYDGSWSEWGLPTELFPID